MNRNLQGQTLTLTFLQKNTLINWGILGSLILTFMLSTTSSFATCYGNVNDGGEIGSDQTTCSSIGVTLTNEDLPSGGYGDLEYLWLSNASGPNVSGADSYFSTSPTYNTGNLTETTWFRRCSRRNGCSSWDYGESNWVKITIGNAEFEHVDGVNETACDANDGKIITDPFINQGTVLPYSVEYTYNGQVFSAGPYTTNEDHYITGLAPGVYSNITIIDANNCSSVWGSDITIAEFNTNCATPCTGEITSIILTNGTESITLVNGGTYQICDLPTDNYLEAIVSGNHESFYFEVDGQTRTENVEPYNYPAVTNGETWNPQVGTHNITGTLYSENGASGDSCNQVSLQITIVGCTPPSCNKYKVTDSNPECHSAFNGAGAGVFFRRDCGETFETWKAGNDLILEELGNGTATLSGSIYNGNTIGQVNLNLEGYSSTGENWSNQCYNDNMTPQYYYTGFSGTVAIGADSYTLIQKSSGVDFVVGPGANNESGSQFGFGAWLDGTWGNCVEAFGNLTPILPGDTCDDGNSSTINDVILADGCTCAGNPSIVNTCELTDFDTRLLWLNYDNTGVKKFAVDSAFIVTEYSDGTATVTGTATQVDNSNKTWQVNVKLLAKRTWTEWSALGRSYKPNNTISYEDHTTWSYYELDNNNSTFTGLGDLAGKTLNITHNPSDYEFGFQVGLGANLKDGDEGFSGWFAFTGDYTGHGDFNGDFNCGTVDCSQVSENIPGYIYLGEFNGSKYYCSNTNDKTWDEANSLAQSIGGHLAVINNQDENDFLQANMLQSSWIGYTDAQNEGTFDWTFGNSSFSNWNAGEPNNYNNNEDYTEILKSSGKWNDLPGSHTREFIVEIECGVLPATIGDWVFNDVNGNGIQEAGEFGLPGVSVMLINTDDNSSETTTTNQNGNYEFTNVIPGNYKVKFPETGASNSFTYNLTKANQGNDGYKDSDPIPMNNGSGNAMTDIFVVNAGDMIDTIDAGYYIGSTIAGIAFIETDVDGLQNGNEDRLDGVIVMLLDENGNMIATTTTANGGAYEFENLAPGNYKIKFPEAASAASTDYSLTRSEVGADDDIDSDAVPMNDGSGNAMTQIVYVQNGATVDNLDAGYYPLAKIGNRVFLDVNENGIQDNDDGAYTDVNIMLIGTDVFGNSVNETTSTDGDGFYSFANVVPGTYELKFTSNQITYIPTIKDFSGNDFDEDDSDIYPGSGRTDVITINAGEVNNTIDAGFIFDASLPVQLISFEAQLINGSQVLLKWATASEINNRHFVVERSADGTDFRPIGLVEGNGTTNLINHYSLDDTDPFYGANYYRLKQVDYNGDSEYSPIATVIVSGDNIPDVIVYPNPVMHTTTLRVVTPFETDAQIEIISQSGKIIKVLTMEAGANSKQLDLSNYSAGIYYAYINYNGHRTLVHHIVKVDE
ncbi:MAG: SdrD B-like domain-containing protein [Saprospiraceae bacterium]